MIIIILRDDVGAESRVGMGLWVGVDLLVDSAQVTASPVGECLLWSSSTPTRPGTDYRFK